MPNQQLFGGPPSGFPAKRLIQLSLLSGLCVAQAAMAQPPVAGPFSPQATASPETPDPVAEDTYLRELRRYAAGSNDQLALAIREAIRLALIDDGNRFFQALGGRELTDADRTRLAQRISADLLLRVLSDPRYSEVAAQQAQALLSAAKRELENPRRLSEAIAAIGTADADAQLAAYRQLLASGEASIGPLSVAAARETDVNRRDSLLSALRRFGRGGPAALAQLALYGAPSVASGALIALDRLDRTAALPYVLAALHSDADDQRRDTAAALLSGRYRSLPTRYEVELFLLDHLMNVRRGAARAIRNEVVDQPEIETVWTLAEDGLSLIATRTAAGTAAEHAAADAARLLWSLGDIGAESRGAALLADLAYRYRLDSLEFRAPSEESLQSSLQTSLDSQTLRNLLVTSLESADYSAAIAVLNRIDHDTPQSAHTWLAGDGVSPTPLVAAASHPLPRVRYDAALAISRLQFDGPFRGSSAVLSRWIEMAGLTREPLVLAIETRVEAAGQIERALASLGYRVEVVSSVGDAIEAVDRGGDIRMLVATTVLPDRNAIELLDGVRRRPLGNRLPIFLHGPSDRAVVAAVEQARWETPTTHAEQLPVTISGWATILADAERALPLPALTSIERLDFRREGVEVLGRVASDERMQLVFDIGRISGAKLEQTVARAPDVAERGNVAFGESLLAVLSVADSRESQSTLVDLLTQQTVTAERQEAIADALIASIRRAGLRLSNDDLTRLRERDILGGDDRFQAVDRVLKVIAERSPTPHTPARLTIEPDE